MILGKPEKFPRSRLASHNKFLAPRSSAMGPGYFRSASRRSRVAFLPVHAGGCCGRLPSLRRHQFFLD